MNFTFESIRPKKIYVKIGADGEDQMVKQYYCNGKLVWTAAQTITYYVDTNTVHSEDIEYGNDATSPKSFTPSKSGYTFAGWRADNTASSSVLSSKVVETEPFTLYAVFKKSITCTFKSYNSTQNASGDMYYNNGNSTTASVKIPNGTAYSGWTWRGWSAAGDSTVSGSVAYANGATISGLTEGKTYYGLYHKIVTCTFKSYGSTQNASGTMYYCNGNSTKASITVPNGAAYSGWVWRGWSAAGVTTSNASVAYANGATISGLTSAQTYYGLYYRTRSITNKWTCGYCGTSASSYNSMPSSCSSDSCYNHDHKTSNWHGAGHTTETDYYNAAG